MSRFEADDEWFQAFENQSFLACHPLRPRGVRCRVVPVSRPQHGLCLRGQRLGSPKYPAIRFPQVRCYGFPGSLLLRPVKLLAPSADLTGNFPQPSGLLLPAFRRVGHPSQRWI